MMYHCDMYWTVDVCYGIIGAFLSSRLKRLWYGHERPLAQLEHQANLVGMWNERRMGGNKKPWTTVKWKESSLVPGMFNCHDYRMVLGSNQGDSDTVYQQWYWPFDKYQKRHGRLTCCRLLFDLGGRKKKAHFHVLFIQVRISHGIVVAFRNQEICFYWGFYFICCFRGIHTKLYIFIVVVAPLKNKAIPSASFNT